MNRTLECTVQNPRGIHCRVATKIAEIVSAQSAVITIRSSKGEADCSSVLDVLSLGIPRNTQVQFTADAQDTEAVLHHLQSLLTRTEDP